jgi:hypothetical protein
MDAESAGILQSLKARLAAVEDNAEGSSSCRIRLQAEAPHVQAVPP